MSIRSRLPRAYPYYIVFGSNPPAVHYTIYFAFPLSLVGKESWSIFLLLLRGGCPDTGILRSRPRILGYCERFPCEIWRSNNTSILRVGTADTSILVLTHPVSITVLDPRRRSIPVSQS